MHRQAVLAALGAVALASIGAPVYAKDAPVPAGAWSLSGAVEANSDYRFRGVSLSGHDPQLSASLTLAHRSGIYGNVWASNVQLDGGAVDAETDVALGWGGQLAGFELDLGSAYYLYPAKAGFNYVEFYTKAARQLGRATVGVAVNYAPAQAALGAADNLYLSAFAEAPIGATPVIVRGSLGVEDGAFGDRKVDWRIGLRYNLGAGLGATVDYVDTARAGTPLARAGLLAGLSWGF
jgi:uncharacterized protein (TIGR02001 family)